jgi:hypothetical protein
VRLTGGAGLAATEGRGARVRGSWATWAARGGGEKRGRAGERDREFGPETAQPRGDFSFFFFYFFYLLLF